MNYLIGAVLVVGLVVVLNLSRFHAVEQVQETALNRAADMQSKILEQQARAKEDAYNAEKIKVYVRARDTKTCMRILKTDVINNEVAECNKDHSIEIRRDELVKFKKENEL